MQEPAGVTGTDVGRQIQIWYEDDVTPQQDFGRANMWTSSLATRLASYGIFRYADDTLRIHTED